MAYWKSLLLESVLVAPHPIPSPEKNDTLVLVLTGRGLGKGGWMSTRAGSHERNPELSGKMKLRPKHHHLQF